MDVILTKDVEHLGKEGQILSVKSGYARNFLLPRGLCVTASPASRAQFEHLRAIRARAAERQKAGAKDLATRLDGMTCTFRLSAGEQGRVHGAVTAGDIVEFLGSNRGISIERHQLELEGPIAQLGVTSVSVKLHPEITATLKIQLLRK
jgi:large subunit ribosomal protein L9